MNKAYVTFIGILAALWIATLSVDIVMTLSLYPSRFGAIANLTEGVALQNRIPIYVIVGLPEAVGLFLPPYFFWAVWIGIVSVAVAVFLLVSLYKSLPKFGNSSLFKIAEFFAVNLFLSYVYIDVIAYLGHPITSPFTPGAQHFLSYFFSTTNAGLYEELISRVAYIGIPLFVYYAWSRHGKKSPSRPNNLPWWRIVWGGGYRFGKPEIIVLVFSSLIFGIAHAGTWDASKIPQAALGGVFLGLLYMRFGLYADVLFHFSVDSPSVLFTSIYGSPVASTSSTTLYALFLFIFVAAGLAISVIYVVRFSNLLSKRRRIVPPSTPSESQIPLSQPDRNQIVGANACPKCGSTNVGFLYDDIYRCNGCGTVYKKS